MPLVPPAKLQFCDANGAPYAGGTIDFYVPGTSTRKDTWQDEALSVLNTNPIILDAAGRAIIWGDGQYRMVLRDAAANLVWDQVTDTIVSAAMQPVVGGSIVNAQTLLQIDVGVAAALATETTARIAGDAAEAAARTAADTTLQNNINAEAATRAAADTANANAIAAETARAEAAEAALAAGGTKIQGGQSATDITGHMTVTFSPAFSTLQSFQATPIETGLTSITPVNVLVTGSPTTGDVWTINPAGGGAALGLVQFYWLALGT